MRAATTKAFTLIELLAVIGTISILIALLIPTLALARDMAKRADCTGNLRQMSLAAQMYAGDWDFYPPAWVIREAYSIAWCGRYYKQDGLTFMDVTGGPLWPYLNEKAVLCCRTFALSQPAVKYAGSGRVCGYGINCHFVAGSPVVDPNDGYAGMTSYARPARVDQMRQPGATILFADSALLKAGAVSEEIFLYPRYKPDGTDHRRTFHFRHRGRANAAFCDGHADRIDPNDPAELDEGMCGWVSNEWMDRR